MGAKPSGSRLEAALSRAADLSRRQTDDATEVDALLREDGPVYAGLTGGQAEVARGRLLLALGSHRLPAAALPYALDDVASPHGAFAVAAAARALRASDGAGDPAAPLLRAVNEFSLRDEPVSLPGAAGDECTTVLTEVFRTLAGCADPVIRHTLEELRAASAHTLDPNALTELDLTLAALPARTAPSGCCGAPAEPLQAPAGPTVVMADVPVEDQDGYTGRLQSLLGGRPSVLAFFYTRCDNPGKCSLTITRLARVRDRLERQGLGDAANVLGMTYDPTHDTAARLHAYGTARGMKYGPRCRLLRTTGGFGPLRDALSLRVGYGPATVNNHAVEIAFLDREGRATTAIVGRSWDEADIYRLLAGSGPT